MQNYNSTYTSTNASMIPTGTRLPTSHSGTPSSTMTHLIDPLEHNSTIHINAISISITASPSTTPTTMPTTMRAAPSRAAVPATLAPEPRLTVPQTLVVVFAAVGIPAVILLVAFLIRRVAKRKASVEREKSDSNIGENGLVGLEKLGKRQDGCKRVRRGNESEAGVARDF